MSCPEQRLVAFLAGELSEDEARQFDVHLLSCEACWTAVQEDRQGRAALLRLREQVPSDLADRVAMAITVGADRAQAGLPPAVATSAPRRHGPRRAGGSSGRHVRRFVVPLLSLAAAVSIALGVWAGVGGRGQPEPPQLAMVLAAARSMSPSHTAGAGPSLVSGHQDIALRYYRVEDQPVLVATSERDFPMPKHMQMKGSTSSDWMATQGKLGLYCVNANAGHRSVLVVAAMPVEALPRVAADLHLLS